MYLVEIRDHDLASCLETSPRNVPQTSEGDRYVSDHHPAAPADRGQLRVCVPQLSGFRRFFINSVAATGASVLLILVMSALGGDALARKEFPGKKALFVFVALVIAVPWIIYLIPTFVMEDALGLRNSWSGHPAVRRPEPPVGAGDHAGAFLAIPGEIVDAARVDGADEFQTWLRVLLPPLTLPELATAFVVVFIWKEFLYAVTLMTDSQWRTLPVRIIQIRDELQTLAYNVLSPTSSSRWCRSSLRSWLCATSLRRVSSALADSPRSSPAHNRFRGPRTKIADTGLSARCDEGYAVNWWRLRGAQSFMRGGPVLESGHHLYRVGCT